MITQICPFFLTASEFPVLKIFPYLEGIQMLPPFFNFLYVDIFYLYF